jgi:hypothetical protein
MFQRDFSKNHLSHKSHVITHYAVMHTMFYE